MRRVEVVCYPLVIGDEDGRCVYWPRSIRDAVCFKSYPLPDDESPF